MWKLIFSILSCGNTCIQMVDHEETSLSNAIKFGLVAELIALTLDITNFVLDGILILDLFDNNKKPYGILLSVAGCLAFYGEFITKSLIKKVKKDLSHGGAPVANYFITMYMGEIAIYAIEDVTTIYLYWKIDDVYDPSSFKDVLNIYTSCFSGAFAVLGIVLTFLLCLCCGLDIGQSDYFENIQAFCRNILLFTVVGIFMSIPIIAAVKNIILGHDLDEQQNGQGITEIFLGICLFFGIIFLIVLTMFNCMYVEGSYDDEIPELGRMEGFGSKNNQVSLPPSIANKKRDNNNNNNNNNKREITKLPEP